MNVATFEELQPQFDAIVQKLVWSTVSTVDRRGRPRTRIMHPVWEGFTGWTVSWMTALKVKHLAANPYLSASYFSAEDGMVYAECRSGWVTDIAERERVWAFLSSFPGPYGYDPAALMGTQPDDARLGLLKLAPWRVEVSSFANLAAGKPALVWQPPA